MQISGIVELSVFLLVCCKNPVDLPYQYRFPADARTRRHPNIQFGPPRTVPLLSGSGFFFQMFCRRSLPKRKKTTLKKFDSIALKPQLCRDGVQSSDQRIISVNGAWSGWSRKSTRFSLSPSTSNTISSFFPFFSRGAGA